MFKLNYQTEGMKVIWDGAMLDQIKSALQKKYLAFLNDETFEIEAAENKDQVQLRTTLLSQDGKNAYPVECVVVKDSENEATAADLAELMLDYIDVYWNEYLTQGRDVFVTMDWSKHTCEGVDFFVRGFVRQVDLEAQAEALLEQHGLGHYEISSITSET